MPFKLTKIRIAVVGENERSVKVHDYLKARLNAKIISPSDFDSKKVKITSEFDLIFLVGYGSILSSEELKRFGNKLLTCHAGLLPEFRGSSPMNWAIIKNQKYFGLSVIQTDEKIDAGDIFEAVRLDLNDGYTISDLHNLANQYFPQMVFATILKILFDVKPVPQLTNDIYYYPRRDYGDSECDFFNETADEIKNKFRAVVGKYHDPWFTFKNQRIIIKGVDTLSNYMGSPGKIYQIKNDRVLVKCKLGAVWITIDNPSIFERYDSL